MDVLEKVVNPKKLAKNPSCKDLLDINNVSEDKNLRDAKRDAFFCNQEQEADDLCVRATNEKKFDLLDEANCKRSEANEMRELTEQIEKAIATQKERFKNLYFF